MTPKPLAIPFCPTCHQKADASIATGDKTELPGRWQSDEYIVQLKPAHPPNGAWLHGIDNDNNHLIVFWLPAAKPKGGDKPAFTYDAKHSDVKSTIMRRK